MKKALSRLASTLMGALVATEKVSDLDMEDRCDDIHDAKMTLIDQCRAMAAPLAGLEQADRKPMHLLLA